MLARSQIPHSLLKKISLEIAEGRALWALVILNTYERSAATRSLRALAIKKLLASDGSKFWGSHLKLIHQVIEGKSLCELGTEAIQRIKCHDVKIRRLSAKKIVSERMRINCRFVESLRTKGYRPSLRLPGIVRREIPHRNRSTFIKPRESSKVLYLRKPSLIAI